MNDPLVTIWVNFQKYRFRSAICDEVFLREFLAKIERRQKSGCWIWTAAVTDQGYGVGYFKGLTLPAHRLSYMLFVGDIPEGYHVHHKCETPGCVNPKHLEATTPTRHVLELTPNAITYKNARKTHCIRGHELAGDNLNITKRGTRRCRACLADWMREKRAAQRLANPKPPRTHCRKGHEINEENSYVWNGKRYCRPCHLEFTNKQYREKQLALAA